MKRFLYRGYRRYSGNPHWLVRGFSPAGIVVVICIVATACLGSDTNMAVAYQPFVFLSILIVFSMLWSLRPKPKVTVRRSLPRTASVGIRFHYTVHLTNKSRRTVRGLGLIERMTDARPSLQEFLNIPEPGESARNIVDRILGFYRWRWLLSLRLMAKLREQTAPPLPPGATRETVLEMTPLRRGILEFTGMTLARSDPFGLFRSMQEVSAPDKLVILPKRYPVPLLDLPGSMKYQPGGVTLASSVGESEEFISLREYRPGDSLRHLHWKSWAKTGKPIVKEFQDEYFVRHAMILDTFTTVGETELFEEAVSVAASFACSIQTSDSLLDVLFVEGQAYCFTSGRGLAHTGKLLEILAAVKTCPNKPFSILERLTLDHLPTVSGCLCIFLAWDEPRQNLARQIRMRNVPLQVFVMTPEEEPRLNPGPLSGDPARFRQIPVPKVREALLRQ